MSSPIVWKVTKFVTSHLFKIKLPTGSKYSDKVGNAVAILLTKIGDLHLKSVYRAFLVTLHMKVTLSTFIRHNACRSAARH